VVSGFSEEASADRFPPDQIAAFVRKPYEPEDLVDAIRASLGSRSGPAREAASS